MKRRQRSILPRATSLVPVGEYDSMRLVLLYWTVTAQGGNDERAAASAAGPNQGRREGIGRTVRQPRHDPSQRRGVHFELHLHFPECAAGQAGQQRHREPGTRQAPDAGAQREYFTV